MENLTVKQKTDFSNRLKIQTDEELVFSYFKKGDYQPIFIDLVIEELKNRGYNPSELSSYKVAQTILIKKKTDNELIKIYTNPDDYKKELVNLSKKEIENRKLPIDSINAEKTKNEILFREEEQGSYTAAGYIFGIIGGIIGIIIGCQYMLSKHENINGDKFYRYNKSTRKHGKIILILSVVTIIFTIIVSID